MNWYANETGPNLDIFFYRNGAENAPSSRFLSHWCLGLEILTASSLTT